MLEMPLVLGEIAPLVRLRQHAPLFRGQADGVSQCLIDKVTIVRTVSSTTQRGECQCVRCVVRKIESAGVRKVGATCVA